MPMMVVFPAPLGPRSAKKSPVGTVRETPFRASVPFAYFFFRSLMTSAGSDMSGDYTKLMSRSIPFGAYARICRELFLEQLLNRIERFLRFGLKTKNERRDIRRCSDETPAVVDIDTCAVYIDNAVPFFLEAGGEFFDNAVFVFIGRFHLDRRGRDVIGSLLDERRDRLFLRIDVFKQFQPGEKGIVESVIPFCE